MGSNCDKEIEKVTNSASLYFVLVFAALVGGDLGWSVVVLGEERVLTTMIRTRQRLC
jgi:hypothetical protein